MRFFYIIVFLFLPLLINAKKQGQGRIDSLLKELPAAKEDTNKVKVLNDLSISFSSIHPDEGIKYGQLALALATQLNWGVGMARANSVLGSNYHSKADYRKALEYNFIALKINEEIGNKNGIAAVTNNIGLYYQTQSDYPKALEYYFRSLKINEEMGYKNYKAANLSNIGEVYAAQNNYPVALEYDLQSLKLFEELDNKNGVANQLQNIGIVYSAQKNYPQALEYYFKALRINEETGSKSGMVVSQSCIGNVYLEQKKYPEALSYFTKALKINEELGNKDGIGRNLGDIGEYYLQLANDISNSAGKTASLNTAIEYLNKGIATCVKVGDLDNIRKFSHSLSEAYTRSGKYKEAYESYRLYTTMKDSVFSASNKMKIANLETEREIGLKNKQLEIDKLDVKKKRNERVFFIAGILLLLWVMVVVMRNYNTQKNSNILLSKEKQRSDDLLLNILPAEVANELKDKGTAEARYYDNVTVLFTNFVNFTQVSENMTPQQLINELHACFQEFDNILGRYNIEKIKTIGDAYLAAAGLPVPDALHAENMVRSAIDIRDFMHNRRMQMGNKTFEVQIGIHSGSVVAGIVGVKKFAYDIWGDTVNTASRMKENSGAGKINISQTTYELVKDKFKCSYRGEIIAKNKGSLKMYYVEDPDSPAISS